MLIAMKSSFPRGSFLNVILIPHNQSVSKKETRNTDEMRTITAIDISEERKTSTSLILSQKQPLFAYIKGGMEDRRILELMTPVKGNSETDFRC